jgi:hypothetical protein
MAGKPTLERPLVRSWGRWEDNIKIILKTLSEELNWIHLVQDVSKSCDAVMNLRVL